MAKKNGNVEEVKGSSFKCEEALVAFVVREYDAEGKCLGERTSDPVKVFRAAAPNIWEAIDQHIGAK